MRSFRSAKGDYSGQRLGNINSMSTEPEPLPEESPSAEPSFDRELVIVEEPDALRLLLTHGRNEGGRIGVVPTMGALHAGHLSLMQAARAECDLVVATIFVNPLQFGPNEDFERYPRPLEQDIDRCREAGVDFVFHPAPDMLYPPGFDTSVEVGELSMIWEGTHRPSHFRGVTTVVLKLLNIVEADIAFFGLKDYQQLTIIRRMCRDLHVPTEIRGCPTVRDADGLALSSRNQYLSGEERNSALALWKSLSQARERLLAGERDLNAVRQGMRQQLASTPGIDLDYATLADPETLIELSEPQSRMVALVAAKVGKTRLIDNIQIDLGGTP
jgi:pantoate--beta-alanine ligase